MNSKPISLTAAILAGCMAVTAAAAHYAKPTKYLADSRPRIELASSLPSEFDGWRQQIVSTGVVNPLQEELLNALYSEIVNRVYVNNRGHRVMLSIAYGKNQSDSLQVHKPEVCYPAQGFKVASNKIEVLNLDKREIQVRRLETNFGNSRREIVTYWTTIGNEVVKSDLDKKIREIRYSLEGYIADGLLFRISSVGGKQDGEYDIHDQFATSLMSVLSEDTKVRLFGK